MTEELSTVHKEEALEAAMFIIQLDMQHSTLPWKQDFGRSNMLDNFRRNVTGKLSDRDVSWIIEKIGEVFDIKLALTELECSGEDISAAFIKDLSKEIELSKERTSPTDRPSISECVKVLRSGWVIERQGKSYLNIVFRTRKLAEDELEVILRGYSTNSVWYRELQIRPFFRGRICLPKSHLKLDYLPPPSI